MTVQPSRMVLNAGSGAASARGVHRAFHGVDWKELRLDIDPTTGPDLVGTLTDLSTIVPSHSIDAIWASHSLEHLYAHEVPAALSEFRRILKPNGFALITSPDLETIASLLVERGLDHVAYQSPTGPIMVHDVIFGHGPSIKRGKTFMAHHSGFTCASLGSQLLAAGFPMVLGKRLGFDIWALALMEESDKVNIQTQLHGAGLDMFDQ